MTVLSILSTDETLAKVIDSELIGIDYEFIVGPWQAGFAKSTGKFVCFLERDSDFRGGMFVRGLLDILIKPGYAKLAMISPAIEELAGDRTVFGYDIDCEGAITALITPKSLSPYLARVGYVPGAIIRATALQGCSESLKDMLKPLQLSTDFSMYLWNSGKQIHIDPRMVYQIDNIDPSMRRSKRDLDKSRPTEQTQQIWKRESV